MAEWTTEDVRDELVRGFDPASPVFTRRIARWRRWLAAHDAEVAAKALEDAADEFENRYGLLSGASVRARAAALRGGGQ